MVQGTVDLGTRFLGIHHTELISTQIMGVAISFTQVRKLPRGESHVQPSVALEIAVDAALAQKPAHIFKILPANLDQKLRLVAPEVLDGELM